MPKRRTLDVKLTTIQKKIVKSHRKSNGIKVRKMLAAVMEQQQARQVNGGAAGGDAAPKASEGEEFYSTGRTGRRNALPDILGENAHVTSSDLPARLQALTTSTDPAQPGTSTSTQPSAIPGPSNASQTPKH